MHPERLDRANVFSAWSLASLGTTLLAFVVFQFGAAMASESRPQSWAGPTYDWQSYTQELERLDAGLDDTRKSPENLHAYRESIPKAWSVHIGDRHYVVPTDLLVSRLLKAESKPELRDEQLDQARVYLRTLSTETALLSMQPPPHNDSARAKLDAILARSEYAHSRKESWWDGIRARFNEMISDALVRLLRGVGGQASLGYALLWIGICATAILIAWWIFRRWARIARGEEIGLQMTAIPSRSWQEWTFSAREAAGRGDYRMAVHCAYWAGIARLQDVGAISIDRAKTPREYLHALAKSKLILPETMATRREALSKLTSRQEKIWYGYQIATEADFRDSLTQLETLGCHLP
jgi:hypothetical protein